MDKTIAQEHAVNVFEQTLEQKEPMDCVTRALPSEEWKEKRLPPLEEGERKTTFVLGPISLKEIFRWKRSERRHINPEGGNLSKDDELVFVARIPLAPASTLISLQGELKADTSTLFFVVFFQKRRNDLDNTDNSVDGKVYTINGDLFTWSHHVNPEYEACFLYLVPTTNTTRMELTSLEVWFNGIEDGYTHYSRHIILPYVDHREVAIALLRAGALALIKGADEELYQAWLDTFFMSRLDSRPEFLASIVDVCNALLQRERRV